MKKSLVNRVWHPLVLAILCAPALMFANDPGGGTNGVGPNVTLTDNGSTLTLANGTLTAQITKDNAHITSLLYQGRQMVNGDIYFSMDGGDTYSQPSGCVLSIVTNTPDMVDIGLFSLTNSRAQKFDIEVHYVLRRGDSGLYVYAVLNHPADYPDTSVGEWRMVWKMNQDQTERIYVDDIRNWQKPSAYDLDQRGGNARRRDRQAHHRPVGGPLHLQIHVSRSNTRTSAVTATPATSTRSACGRCSAGFDYFNDGPTKQDLAPADGIIHIHFGRNHYNASSTSVAAGEAWTKMYGPWLLYCNTNAGRRRCLLGRCQGAGGRREGGLALRLADRQHQLSGRQRAWRGDRHGSWSAIHQARR